MKGNLDKEVEMAEDQHNLRVSAYLEMQNFLGRNVLPMSFAISVTGLVCGDPNWMYAGASLYQSWMDN